MQPEVRKAVQARMMDPNAAVREATTELIGKYLIAKPEYVPQYYPLLIERIKVTGSSEVANLNETENNIHQCLLIC